MFSAFFGDDLIDITEETVSCLLLIEIIKKNQLHS